MLGGDHRAELFGMLFQQDLEFAHYAGALQGRCIAPLGKGSLCVGNGVLHSGFAGQQDTLFSLTGSGVINVLRTLASRDGFAADKVANEG